MGRKTGRGQPDHRADRNRGVRRTESRGSHRRNLAAGLLGEDSEPVEVAGLALVVRHAERGVTLEMLDGGIVFARGQRDSSTVTSLWKSTHCRALGDRHAPMRPDRRLGFGAGCTTVRVAHRPRALRVAAAMLAGLQRRAEIPAPAKLRHDGAHRAERSARTPPVRVLAQFAAGLAEQMHRRRPAAGHRDDIGVSRSSPAASKSRPAIRSATPVTPREPKTASTAVPGNTVAPTSFACAAAATDCAAVCDSDFGASEAESNGGLDRHCHCW